MIQLNVQNETDPLEAVLLGIADSVGPTPSIEEAYDPKSKESIRKGVYPVEADMRKELDAFAKIFEKYEVELFRPEILPDVNQIFSRDIAFVINDFIVVANVLKARSEEIHAIDHVLEQVAPEKIIRLHDHVRIEGGDVMPWNGNLFVGYSEPEDFDKYRVSRTNREGVDFLKEHFTNLELRAFELVKSDEEPMKNALHLDCCFQPIGKNQAIMYKGGFKNQEDVKFLESYFGKENIIEIDAKEMYLMYSNVFSLSPEVIVSEKTFTRLNNELRNRGFRVEEVPFFEISKQEGLLRCTTLPLRRTH